MNRRSRSTIPAGPHRVVGYVRISVDRENETSTTTQAERIAAYCVANGWELADTITESGRSAFKASRGSRPGLARAVDMIERGEADTLVVWALDRATRNTRDLLGLVDAVGGRFVSVTEAFDTSTPTGRMILTVLGALAELESAHKSDRTLEWWSHRKANGAPPAGRPALGYVKDGPTSIDVDPEAAPVVAEVARRVAARGSLRAAIAWAAEQGYPRTSRTWVRVLQSPTLAGLVAHGDVLVAGDWPAIVDRATWERVGVILRDPGRARSRQGGERRWPLSGIVRCSCGARLRVQPQSNRPARLECTACGNSTQYAPVEAFVEAAMLDLLDDATWRRLAAGRPTAMTSTELAPETVAQLDNLRAMVASGLVPLAAYDEAVERAEAALSGDAVAPPDVPDLDSVRAAWPSLDADARHRVLAATIQSLTVGRVDPAKRGPGSGRPRFDPERISLRLVD